MTGLKNSPPPTSAAAMKRCTPAARHGETISMLSHASGRASPSDGRWLIHNMYGTARSQSRSSAPRTSTSMWARPVRPASSSDGRSGTYRSGASVMEIGNDRRVWHPGPPAADAVDVAFAGVVVGDPAVREEPPRAARARGRRHRSVRAGAGSSPPPLGRGSRRRARTPRRVWPRARPCARPRGRRPGGRRRCRARRTSHRGQACRARLRTDRPASPASGSGTSARRRDRAPRAHRGRTGSRATAGSGGPGASRRRRRDPPSTDRCAELGNPPRGRGSRQSGRRAPVAVSNRWSDPDLAVIVALIPGLRLAETLAAHDHIDVGAIDRRRCSTGRRRSRAPRRRRPLPPVRDRRGRRGACPRGARRS